MTDSGIEDFIKALDYEVCSKELCVYPDKQTFECCDCYMCHVDFYNKVRDELHREK